MRIILFLFLICSSQIAYTQNKYTISGFIKEEKSDETLIGASVYNPILKIGVNSNQYGFYSLTLPEGKHKIIFSYIGFVPIEKEIELNNDIKININLSENKTLQEVEIKASKSYDVVEESQMSKMSLPIDQIKKLPAFLGETDVMKVVQLLPGIKGGTEGTAGIYVRGGGPDQNLILLDGVPVYNVNHLFGFFSVFNSDAINNIDIYTGSFPARYGGRLSSVLDIRMREGNMDHYTGEVSVGIVSSKATIEGPLKKNKASFLLTGRRTYIDILAQPIVKWQSDGKVNAGYYFYDYNAKLNWRINEKNRVFLSGYFGNDKAYGKVKEDYGGNDYSNQSFGLRWGNITAVARLNTVVSKKIFNNLTFNYTRYQFLTTAENEDNYLDNITKFKVKYFSGIRDLAIKNDVDIFSSSNHYIKFGVGAIHHTFKPGALNINLEESTDAIDTTFKTDYKQAIETDAYIEDDIKLGGLVKMNVGVHYSTFWVDKTQFQSLQPRISTRIRITDKMSMKAGYAHMAQYLHLLSNNGLGLPTDLWVPVTKNLKPQVSHQWALGLANTLSPTIDFTIEGYYKKMQNVFEYKEGANYLNAIGNEWETKLERGKAWSYGVEFLFQKKEGKTTGLLGYTLAWAWRQFDNINLPKDPPYVGMKYPFKYDRRHDLSIAFMHEFSKRIEFSSTFVFSTGNAITLPESEYANMNFSNYFIDPNLPLIQPGIENYSGRNNYRMPPNHRLDLGLAFKTEHKHGLMTITMGVYNAYNHFNPFFITRTRNNSGKEVFRQISLFPIIPSISVGFKFK